MKPRLKRAAWVGLALMVGGWVLAVAGFSPAETGSRMSSEALLQAVRVAGFFLIVTGATVAVFATVHGPVVVMVGGAALNLAHQAGLISQSSTGVAGAGLILLGALWGSRRIRQLPS